MKITKILYRVLLASAVVIQPASAQNIIFRYNPGAINVAQISVISSLPDFYVGESSTSTLSVTGGLAPYLWSSTGSFPPGLSLSSSGVLSGTATAAGLYPISLQVQDNSGDTASSGSLAIAVYDQLVADPLHSVLSLGTPETRPLSTTGGKAPISFSVISGSLPPGISISGGSIRGTPTALGENYRATVQARDANGKTASIDVDLSVYDAIVTGANFPETYVGDPINGQFTATGGTGIFNWSEGPSFPQTLSLNTTSGVITGALATSGSHNVSVTVHDGVQSEEASASINAFAIPSIATKNFPDPYVGIPYTATEGAAPVATGGKGTLTWSATGLPSGMDINPANGLISGTSGTVSSSNATIVVTDVNGRSGSRSYAFTPRAALSVATPFSSPIQTYVPVDVALSATGGLAPYTFTVTGLPAGLSVLGDRIQGTATNIGSYAGTITVTDDNNKTASRAFSGNVEEGLAEVVISSASGPINVQALFNAQHSGAWSSSRPKRLRIAAGAAVSSTNPVTPTVTVGAPWVGSLTLDVQGEIQGAPGTAGTTGVGGKGGDTILIANKGTTNQTMSLNVTGAIKAGGGGGGKGGSGGVGGGGTATESPAYTANTRWEQLHLTGSFSGNAIRWNGTNIPAGGVATTTTFISGVSTYTRGAFVANSGSPMQVYYGYFQVSRTGGSTNGGAAGAGGNGGRGVGSGAATAGAGIAGGLGVAGGTSAGRGGNGGAGGTGGGWGLPGAKGNNGLAGIAGNRTAAGPLQAGFEGGLAGFVVNGAAHVTNSGTGTQLGR